MSASSDIAELVETALGVPHRRRRIAVDRAVVALPVDQRQAHREILRHAHQRVVDRLVAVRVIFTHHVADHAGRFDVFLVRRMAVLVHRKQDAPMHRLETVTRVRERPRHDHAHRVIEVAALHLLGDGNGANVRGRLGCRRMRDCWCQTRAKNPANPASISIADSIGRRHPKSLSACMIFTCFFNGLDGVFKAAIWVRIGPWKTPPSTTSC